MTLVPIASWIYYMDEYKSYLNKTSFPTSMLNWNIHRSHTHTSHTKRKTQKNVINVKSQWQPTISHFIADKIAILEKTKNKTPEKNQEKKQQMKAGRAQTAILQKPHFHNIVIFLIICTPFESAINRDPSISHTRAYVYGEINIARPRSHCAPRNEPIFYTHIHKKLHFKISSDAVVPRVPPVFYNIQYWYQTPPPPPLPCNCYMYQYNTIQTYIYFQNAFIYWEN